LSAAKERLLLAALRHTRPAEIDPKPTFEARQNGFEALKMKRLLLKK
jgi:hypothetical protein